MSTEPTEGGVSPETLARLPSFYQPIASPSGDEVALYHDRCGRNELHVLDRESGRLDRVTDGEVPRDATYWLRWGPDGDRVFFHRDDAGDEQNDLYAWHRDGGVEPVVELDGQSMLFDVGEEMLLFGSDAGRQLNLYRHDLETGETEQLTEHRQPTMGGVVSPDGDRIAYVTNESADLDNQDVYLLAADGTDGRRVDLGADGSETHVHAWFPDGDRLLVSDNETGLRRVGIYDLRDGDSRWLGPNDHPEAPQAVSPDGRYVVATRTRKAAEMPVVYDLDAGDGWELAAPEGDASFPEGGGDGAFVDETTVVFTHSTPTERPELYEYDLATDEYEVLVAADYGDADPATFVDAEYVTYEGADDWEIGALLYDPRDGPSRSADATEVPGVVMVHGGPPAQSTKGFHILAQLLATQGYAVLQPNYRGSTGRGREFRRAIHGDWGGAEQADVAAGGRWLMDREWVDADRVGVFGGSFGGYSVYSQLTQYPTLWATGVAWVGITDLHALYEEDMPHFQHMLRKQMGDPEENHDLWRERSPIERVDAVERPLCMIHGVNDPRCPVDQARVFRDGLEARGWTEGEEFEYVELGEEGHGSTDIEQKVRTFDLVVDYLDRRL